MAEDVSVLVVDDSAYMRVVLRDMLQSEEGICVLGTARDGIEGLAKVKELGPDVVLLDIQMPKMDGLATLQRIMREAPTRVVMLSAMNKVDVHLPLKALELGAVDFIPKPGGPVSVDIVRYRKTICDVVRSASMAKVDVLKRMRGPMHVRQLKEPVTAARPSETKTILLAASTGGPRSLEAVFAALPRNLNAAIIVVQHLPAEFSLSFAKRLDSAKGPRVVLATDGLLIEPGTAYLAPGGVHLRLEPNNRKGVVARLDDSLPVQFVRPSANVLFESAARCYGDKLLAVVMTGMGSDGAEGARVVKASGGRVIAQDEDSSVIFGMAKAVINDGTADEVVPLQELPKKIMDFIEG